MSEQAATPPSEPDSDTAVRAALDRAAASIQRLASTPSHPWSAFTEPQAGRDIDLRHLAGLLVERARLNTMRPGKLADTDPIAAVVQAWTHRGVTPGRHAVAAAEVRDAMPELADALDQLAAVNPGWCDLSWRPIEP